MVNLPRFAPDLIAWRGENSPLSVFRFEFTNRPCRLIRELRQFATGELPTKGTVLKATLKPPSNFDKAALLLKRLAPSSLAKVLESFGPEQASKLRSVMDTLAKRPDFAVLSEQVLQEFRELQQDIQATVDEATRWSEAVLPLHPKVAVDPSQSSAQPAPLEAATPVENTTSTDTSGSEPLQELQSVSAAVMATVLMRESPRVMALVLKQLTAEVSSRVLGQLPTEIRQQTFVLMADKTQINPVVVQSVLRSIANGCRHVDPAVASQADSRFSNLLNLLQKLEREERIRLIEVLSEHDPELSKQIDDAMYDYADLMRIEDRSVQKILSQLEQKTVALAIKTAPEDLREKVMRNLSERVRGMLTEEMELLGTVPTAKADPARREIADAIRSLDKEGSLVWME